MSEKKRRGPRSKFKLKDPDDINLPMESNEIFSYIAGYTSGGAAYGLTWEEFNAYDQDSAIKNEIEESENE
jgi:hypothetical protein